MSRTPAFVVFAFVALFALLIRPLCGVHEMLGHAQPSGAQAAAAYAPGDGAEHGHPAGCCASMHETMLAAPGAAVPATFKSHPAVVATAFFTPAWRFAASPLAARVQLGAPPAPRSYYARSARILS